MALIKEEIVLSISIPTYNRASLLKRCLDSIFKHNNANNLPVEVSIYNNFSTDNTDSVIKEFLNQGYRINYVPNPSAIEGNLNIYQCYVKARGKYILTLGDDDVFIAGSLERMVTFLSSVDAGVVFLNYGSTLDYLPEQKVEELSFKKYNDPVRFIRKINFHITFISANIIRNPEIQETAPLQNNNLNFTQVPLILSASFRGYDNYYCKTIIMAAQPNDFVGYDIVQVFLKNLLFVIRQVKIDASAIEKVTEIIKNQLAISFFPYWMRKTYNKMNPDEKKKILNILSEDYKENSYYRLFIKPSILYPDPFAKGIVLLSRVFNKFRSYLLDVH